MRPFAPERSFSVAPRLLRQLLQLILGAPIEGDVDWGGLLALAARERLAALAWQRSGSLIRSSAPPTLVSEWRATAMSVALQVEVLLGAVAPVVSDMRQAGIDVVVLKGAPLGHHLYGDALVRPLADCDLFVPLAQRRGAADVLAHAGWTSRTGEPPSEETFERWSGGQRNVIEVHSSVIDDGALAHVEIPAEAREVPFGGVAMPALLGDVLPAYLAAHIAKHETASLLWIIDLHTVWSRLDESERSRASARARHLALHRHLKWAVRLGEYLELGAAGDDRALAVLGGLRQATGDWGRVRRLVGLSANPMDALRVVAGRIWPAEWRDSWTRAPSYVLRRGAGWLVRRLQLVDTQRVTSRSRGLAVDDDDLSLLLADTLGRGLAVWIQPRGASMQPAIPPSAAARIVPLDERVLRQDDIVLARLPHGQFVLHRVQRLSDDIVQLKGDAMRRRDCVVERSQILGICDQVEIDGAVYAAEERPRDSIGVLRLAARSRLRKLVSTHGP